VNLHTKKMSRYICFTKLKHLIFQNGGNTCYLLVCDLVSSSLHDKCRQALSIFDKNTHRPSTTSIALSTIATNASLVSTTWGHIWGGNRNKKPLSACASIHIEVLSVSSFDAPKGDLNMCKCLMVHHMHADKTTNLTQNNKTPGFKVPLFTIRRSIIWILSTNPLKRI
jgi:hypothetical protein